jgi:hypothetical protein
MSTPENPLGYAIDTEYLVVGALVGLLGAFVMWRWGLRRTVGLVPITLTALFFWSPLYLPAVVVAGAIIWVGGYLQSGDDEDMLSFSQVLGLIVADISLRIPKFKWRGWVLFAVDTGAVVGIHEASGLSILMLAFMAVQLAAVLWLSTHQQDGRFKRGGILTLRGWLSVVLGLAWLVDGFLAERWLKHRRAMVLASLAGTGALYATAGIQTPQTVIWIWLLCIAWGAGKYTTVER